MKRVQWSLIAILLCGAFLLGAADDPSHYRIANRIHVASDAGWDYITVDESTGRLFVARYWVVDVVDSKNGALIRSIPGTKGAHGVALARELNKGFITCGMDSSVAVFSIDSLKVLARVTPTGKNPDGILYDQPSHLVFVFNGGAASATVIDAMTNKIVATIPLQGKPEQSATDGKGTVFVNLEDKDKVVAIDVAALKVRNEWPIAPGQGPVAMAMDVPNERLFVGCANKTMVVMDATNGKVVGSVPIGEHVDGAAFDPGMKRVYTSNGEGTLTVVDEMDPHTFAVLENVPTQRGARTLALNTKTHHIYLPTAQFGPVPAPTSENPRPRPTILPNSFVILDVEPVK